MRKTLRRGIITVVGATLAGSGLLAAAPAKADCIRAEVVVYWSDGTEQTVWPKSTCIYDIGGDEGLGTGVDQTRGGVPTGLPNGARVGFWAPI